MYIILFFSLFTLNVIDISANFVISKVSFSFDPFVYNK